MYKIDFFKKKSLVFDIFNFYMNNESAFKRQKDNFCRSESLVK